MKSITIINKKIVAGGKQNLGTKKGVAIALFLQHSNHMDANDGNNYNIKFYYQ